MSKNLSTTLALAAAALFLGGCDKSGDSETSSPAQGAAPPAAASAKIKCFGANACEGQGQCNVPDGRVEAGSKGHDCAGQNSCKGKGWLSLTEAECTAKGGEPL